MRKSLFLPSVPSDLGIVAKGLPLKVFCVFLLNFVCFLLFFVFCYFSSCFYHILSCPYLVLILSLSCFAIENGVGFAVFVLKIAAEKYTYARREGRN